MRIDIPAQFWEFLMAWLKNNPGVHKACLQQCSPRSHSDSILVCMAFLNWVLPSPPQT